jgi:DMSO/TMAO reductase YedYZ molybdopterin-dependent catalytic subunit
VSLTALFYAGWKLAGLPFVPFDLFDWINRMLPGAVVTAGIDLLVKIIRALNLGSTDATAKLAEQMVGVAGFLIAGAVAGALLFRSLRERDTENANGSGIVLGLVAGLGAMLVSLAVNRTASAGRLASAIWILGAFLAWGRTLGWAYRRLSFETTASSDADHTQTETVERIDRRRFLINLGGATAMITVGGAFVGSMVGRRRVAEVVGTERWSAKNALPNAGAAVQPAPGTRPEFTPLESHYRIDINALAPVVREENWKLKIHGLVERPVELSLAELREYPPTHQFVTLACISNVVGGDLIGTTRWTGVSLRRLLADLKLRPTATHLKIRSADGFYEIVALATINADERVMLAYAWDGIPLTVDHGFPLRVYIPDLYGMKQPKWIESIEATDRWEPGYWVERDWDSEARMKATSVIDTVAVDQQTTDSAGRQLIPVGGIAHAGARGISRVEVKVDEGEWRAAQLRAPISGTTWVLWRYDWPFESGSHTFTVRCTDGAGAEQIEPKSEPHPSGATGFHRKSARAR